MYFVTQLVLALLLATATAADPTHCALQWRSAGYGKIFPDAVAMDDGRTEFVGRVQLPNREWALGRLAPSSNDGLVHLIRLVASAPKTSATYQLLTNPNKCLLHWVDDDLEPANTVPLQGKARVATRGVIGRTKFGGGWVGGVVTPSGITYTFDGDTYQHTDVEAPYQLLTASHHQLQMHMSDFEFELDQPAMAANTSRVLIGESFVRRTPATTEGGEEAVGLEQSVQHGKMLKETFVIESDVMRCHVAGVHVDMHLWAGSGEPVEQDGSPMEGGLVVNRTVGMGTSSVVRLGGGKQGHVVSSALLFKGRAGFSAKAAFKSESQSERNIAEVVSRCGVRVTGTSGNKEEGQVIVHGVVRGVVKGEFILATETIIS